MSYGVVVSNSDGRVVIDENYSNFYVANANEAPISVAAGTAYPPSGYSSGTLVMAKAPNNTDGYVSRAPNLFAAPYTYEKFEYACDYIIVDPFETTASASTGYGFEVYDGASNVLFSATSNNKVFEVVAVGEIPASDTTTTAIYYPSSTGVVPYLDKYYVALNGTMSWGYFGARTHVDYYYDWVTSTSGRIHINRSRTFGLNSPQPLALTMSYLIMRLRG